MQHSQSKEIPILLLKTKSIPSDGYEERFGTTHHHVKFTPRFMPVLEHRMRSSGLQRVRTVLEGAGASDTAYGGFIFTSQRAVEAFAKLLEELQECHVIIDFDRIPFYSVGPATTRTLHSIPALLSTQILGEETGNGEALAHYILNDYHGRHQQSNLKPPLLFLVGEQRRDIIPTTQMDESMPASRRIRVEEIVVYETGVMESFERDFSQALTSTAYAPLRWVVVFSPTGCEAMLRALGMLDSTTGKVIPQTPSCSTRSTLIATIGPTTRDFLRDTFDYEPDVCAKKPSPEGIEEAIQGYMLKQMNC